MHAKTCKLCVMLLDGNPVNFVLVCFLALDPEIIARGTVGFSGAELENLVNQAALKAAVDGKKHVTMKELEFAKDKILMGEGRRAGRGSFSVSCDRDSCC